MKKLILLLTLVFTITAYAQDEKIVTLTVSGQGKTKDEAKQNALRNAIEQAFGSFISSKTEIFNNQVVVDQITSVSNGNVQSYEILNESQIPNGSWGVTLKALVSIDKLTSFVQAKGVEVEINGGMFAVNIKQQLLNEQGEKIAINQLVGLLHEPMQIAFDYVVNTSDPRSIDGDSKEWLIPLEVIGTANKNIDFCAIYFIKTIEALSLSSEEVINYKSLNKDIFSVTVDYKGESKTFYLRKQSSINSLITFASFWEFYTRLFYLESGLDESSEIDNTIIDYNDKIHNFININDNNRGLYINFLNSGQQASKYSWKTKFTHSQIEKLKGYKVIPSGVVSEFKNGGFVFKEENGHGLVVSITDELAIDFQSAKTFCDNLVFNGYDDWRLPSIEELKLLDDFTNQLGINNFIIPGINWSSTEKSKDIIFVLDVHPSFKESTLSVKYINSLCFFRAIRSF